MTIEFLIHVVGNKLTRLREDRILAESNGDLAIIVAIDNEIIQTEITLNTLRSL